MPQLPQDYSYVDNALERRKRRPSQGNLHNNRSKVKKKSDTCEALRKLVMDTNPNSDSPRERWRKATEDEYADYFRTKRSRTGGKIPSNIMHELVQASKELKWTKDEIEQVVVFVLKGPGDDITVTASSMQYPMEELLEEDLGSGTPILQALMSGRDRNRPFVDVVLGLRPQPSNLGKIFWQLNNRYNTYCLHAAISSANVETSGFDHIREIVQHIRDYKPPQHRSQDRTSRKSQNQSQRKPLISPLDACEERSPHNTALHLAILKAPIDIIFEPNKTGSGPRVEVVSTSASMIKVKELVEILVEANPSALGQSNGKGEEAVRRTPYQERVYRLAIKFHAWNWKRGHKQANGSANNSSTPENTTCSVPAEIAQEAAGYFSDGDDPDNREHNVPPEPTLAQSYYGDDVFREFVISDPIASYISHYCIAHKYREKAMKYLYRPGEERATEFDLLGFPRQKITQDYLSSLETHVRFERTLKYVALPRLVVEATRASNGTQLLSSPTRQTPSEEADMTEIFKWLYKRHVRKIQKVTVLDSEFPSHHDQKIVEALKKFEVEKWDWDKMDLSSHVISDSSASIRDISLHSSGNSAVLEGWCSSAGFGNRERFPQLKKIFIYFHEGQETKKTLQERGRDIQTRLQSAEYEHNRWKLSEAEAIATDAMALAKKLLEPRSSGPKDEMVASLMKELESRLGSLNAPRVAPVETGLEVDFDVVPIMAQTGSSRTRRNTISTENSRISKIKELTSFIRNSTWIERPQTSRVKIAIIDDGLDPSLYIIDRKHCRVVAGQSFCIYSGHTKNYYVPSGNHGTQLASLICQICPEVDLYIARLAEQDTRAGNRVILLDSAERAIKWATKCRVDIMCMSWTIEDRDEQNSPRLRGLRDAIREAHKQGIIMFCSASDQGGGSMVQGCYPGAFDKGQRCIRVGSCSASDVPSVWVDPGQVDFLLPGENLHIPNSDGTPEPQTGSSFATALAVGLAGLILFCALRLRIGITPSAPIIHDNEREEEYSDAERESSHDGDYDSDTESSPNPANGHRSHGKNGANERFHWNRDVMFKVLKQMSKPVGTEQDNLLLPLPEVFFVPRLYDQLKKLKGNKMKPLDKLNWDSDFSAALRDVLHQLIDYQDDKQSYKNFDAR